MSAALFCFFLCTYVFLATSLEIFFFFSCFFSVFIPRIYHGFRSYSAEGYSSEQHISEDFRRHIAAQLQKSLDRYDKYVFIRYCIAVFISLLACHLISDQLVSNCCIHMNIAIVCPEICRSLCKLRMCPCINGNG